MRNAYKILVWQHGDKTPFGMVIDLKEMRCEGVDRM